jgi:DHA1 family multidrug resistance protein-like MFS transporter
VFGSVVGLPRWIRLAALLVATASFRLSQNMAQTTLSLLSRDDLHLGPDAIGGLGAVLGVMVAATAILVASRVPLHLAERSAAIGMLALSASLGVFFFASSLAEMVPATLLLGVSGGLAMTGLVNAVQHGAGEDRDRIIGLYTITLSVSLALGPLLETAVLAVTRQDVRAPYAYFSVFPLVAFALLVFASRRTPSPDYADLAAAGSVTEGIEAITTEAVAVGTGGTGIAGIGAGLGAPGAGPGPPEGAAPSHRRRLGSFGALVATTSGRQGLIIQLLYAIPFAGLTSFGALVARVGFGVSAAQAQAAFTAFFVMSLGSRLLVAWRSPIVRKQPLLWLSVVSTAAGLAVLGLGHGLVVLLVAMAVLGIPHGLTFPLALALVAESTDAASLPRANATLLGSTNLTTVAVPPVLGAVIPVVGYQGMALLLGVPVAGFAAVLATQREPRAG